MAENVIEDLVVPESPKVLPGQPVNMYVPIASGEARGIAKFDTRYFIVDANGNVRFNLDYFDEAHKPEIFVGDLAPTGRETLWVDTGDEYAILKYKTDEGDWLPISSGIGGGGGGGGNFNNAILNVSNTTGWITKTIAQGAECNISFKWSSTENDMPTGNGVLTVSVAGVVKTSYEVTQGEHTVPIAKYLATGTNKVTLEISDAYGNKRSIVCSVNVVHVSIDSYFDGTVAKTGPIVYSYIPKGDVEKLVHFLVDGGEIDTRVVTVSGREQSYIIPS